MVEMLDSIMLVEGNASTMPNLRAKRSDPVESIPTCRLFKATFMGANAHVCDTRTVPASFA